MQDTLRALRSLQELDQDIFRLRDELRRLPEERAQRRARIDATLARRDAAAAKVRETRSRIKEIEQDTSVQRQRVRKLENEATSSRGEVALMVAYQHEIKTLKKQIGAAEEEGLALVESAEEGQAEVDRLQGEIDAAEAVHVEFVANVERESAAARERLGALEAERSRRIDGTIDRETFALYERLLAAREGVALAELDGRICQACFMEMPPNLYVRVARGTQLTQCPSCDRILYARV